MDVTSVSFSQEVGIVPLMEVLSTIRICRELQNCGNHSGKDPLMFTDVNPIAEMVVALLLHRSEMLPLRVLKDKSRTASWLLLKLGIGPVKVVLAKLRYVREGKALALTHAAGMELFRAATARLRTMSCGQLPGELQVVGSVPVRLVLPASCRMRNLGKQEEQPQLSGSVPIKL